jgi:uncharacterized protein (DUF1501 family)
MGKTRRDFLKKSASLVAAGVVAPHVWLRTAMASNRGAPDERVLLVIQLDGGNDGLNTIVPYGMGTYYDVRPNVNIAASSVLDIDGTYGFHPSLAALLPAWQAQKLAVVNGCGYPSPNRSHFRSREIWQTADPVDIESTGWLGRFADQHLQGAGELAAINIGGQLPKSLNAETMVVPSISSLEVYQFLTDPQYTGDRQNQVDAFLAINDRPTATGDEAFLADTAGAAYTGSTELQAAAGSYTPQVTYPTTTLGANLQFAAQIIVAGVGARIIHVTTGGYDTHAQQPNDHAQLLQTLAEALAAFQGDIEGQGVADRVAVLAFSEFGRRVDENGSNGTDHGTAGPMFLLGTQIAGGMYGEYPSLTSLDGNGDLIFTTDFRSVYADTLQNWLGVAAEPILDGSYQPVGTFKS